MNTIMYVFYAGEGVYAYVILKENCGDDTESLKSELRASVKTRITSFAVPDFLQVRETWGSSRTMHEADLT